VWSVKALRFVHTDDFTEGDALGNYSIIAGVEPSCYLRVATVAVSNTREVNPLALTRCYGLP
jgi:hypothetical protein